MKIESPNKNYRTSSKTVFSCQYHIIFCPKYRRPVLVGKIADRLKELIYEACQKNNCNVIEMEIMPDHVHLLLDVDPVIGVSKTIAQIKGISSFNLRKEFPELVSRLPSMWTNSKFISTVGSISLDVVKQYIQNQKNQ